MDSQPVIQSYVRHGDRDFLVSTIERDCSAVAAPDYRYNETIVWAWNRVTRERGEILLTTGEGKGSIQDHFRICHAYFTAGHCEEIH